MPVRDLCIYHKGCVDGFTSAWIAWRATHGNIDAVPGVYGEPPPDVKGRNVFMLDFSYPRDVIAAMASEVNWMLILDHHKTAEAALKEWTRPFPLHDGDFGPQPGKTVAHFDMDRSGAGMTWDYFYPGKPRPRLVNHVEDRDLWHFNALYTREIGAAIYSHEFNFMTWESLMIECEEEQSYNNLIRQGEAIDRAHKKHCQQLIRETTVKKNIDGLVVPCCNAPFFMASDIGNMLASDPDNPSKMAAIWYDNKDGQRVFSLRSTKDGPDVSEIAKKFGGGGHRNAAGFATRSERLVGKS